ncbi:MAG TPA: Lrp/AsnC family transcriptional regulator [Roseateles sp.]
MDAIDRKILELLQADSEIPLADLADKVGLSSTPCWRRIQRMKSSGIILKSVTRLDPKKVNLPVTAFVAVRNRSPSKDWFAKFKATIESMPEVVEFYRLSGEIDYLLRVVVPDIATYDLIYKRLISTTDTFDVTTSFAMEEIKFTTELPLQYGL